MILVMVGTQNNSFHRLLEQLDRLIEDGKIKDKVIVQAGYTKYTSNNMKIIDFMPKDELEKLQEQADLIITHGGVGSIISSIEKGKKVIAIPRLHEYGEHVNNHQKEIVERFSKNGSIIGISGVEELEKGIELSKDFIPKPYTGNNKKMLNIIENFINNVK